MTPTGTSDPPVDVRHARVEQRRRDFQDDRQRARACSRGYSFIYIRDDEQDGIMDRAKHLADILTYLGNTHEPPTDATP